MKLNEKYISNLLTLAGILNENRIEKLRLQKFPEDIIKAVIEFSKLTVKNPKDETSIQQNQYIPWIASELKLDKDLLKNEKLKVVINWINKSNFPRFASNMPFDKVYNIAVNWFLNKNIDPNTLKELSSGDTKIEYPDGSKWILVKDETVCMRVGDTRGWCFSEINRAKDFVKSEGGYMLFGKDGSIKMAVQFEKDIKSIIDWQGAFNKIPDKNSAMKSADLISKLGEITHINYGHAKTITQSLEKYPDFKKWMSSLKNINISPLNRFLLGLEVTSEQLNSISPEEKIKNKIPLSDDDLNRLSPDLKLKYGIKLTIEETEKLSPIAKLAFGYKIKSKDVQTLPPLIQKIISVMKGGEPTEIFNFDDFGKNGLYNNYNADNKTLKLYVGDYDWHKFAGFSDEDQSAWYNRDYSYAKDDLESSEDYKYISYNILGKENQEILKEISQLFGKEIDENEDNAIWNFIDEYLPNSDNIREVYNEEISEYKSDKFRKKIDASVYKEQKFKMDLNTDTIILPWKKLLQFIANKDFYGNIIESFGDLEDAELNGDEGYDLYNVWNSIWPNSKEMSHMQEKIKEYLEEDLENIRLQPDISEKAKQSNYILTHLGFLDRKGKFHSVKMPNGDMMNIIKTDLQKEKFEIEIHTKEGTKKGKIPFDSLANYITTPTLFESKLRKLIRNMLSEDFRFMYDKQNFTPPTDVVYTAQKALNAVNSNKLVQSDASNEGSGLQKAKSLVSKEPITHAQLKRMKAFFDKNTQEVNQERSAGKNLQNSPIIQKWELWGGDAGQKWAEKQIGATQSNNKTSKKVRNSDIIARDNRIMDPTNTRIHR